MSTLVSSAHTHDSSQRFYNQEEISNTIFEITSLNDVSSYLTDFDTKTCIVAFNLHNTLITYEDPFLCSGVNKFIDGLVNELIAEKISTGQIQEAEKEKYMSTILLSAKYKLTEGSVASVIDELSKKFFIMGFTESKTGKFGKIPNAEVWKTELLKSNGITFPSAFNIEKTKRFSDDTITQNYAIFNAGILFVGNKKNKAKVLIEFIRQTKLPISQIVVIDNKKENIEMLQKELSEYNISVLGFFYNYHNDTPINPEVVVIQKKTLFENDLWLSFEDVELQ